MLCCMESAYIFVVTTPDFDAAVARRSMEVPILLEFWADWCDPCKNFAPVLEKVAEEYAGAFLVGKVDTQAEPRLAEAFGVRSIPFAALVVQGQPVDAFSGAIGERELRDFLAKSGVQPLDAVGDTEAPDPDSPEARYGAGLEALRSGSVSVARERLEGIPADDDLHGDADRILQGLTIFDVRESLTDTPAEQAMLRATELLRKGQVRPAVEELLDSIAADKDLREGLARRAILLCFLMIGEEPEDEEELATLRRRLATLVY